MPSRDGNMELTETKAAPVSIRAVSRGGGLHATPRSYSFRGNNEVLIALKLQVVGVKVERFKFRAEGFGVEDSPCLGLRAISVGLED